MKINKYNYSNFLLCQELKTRGFLHPAEADLGYFLVWFQSFQVPSTQSESPLVPKSHVSFKVHTQPKLKLNSVAFSPQANYTDRATAVCRRS
jgi:hypothetical protein